MTRAAGKWTRRIEERRQLEDRAVRFLPATGIVYSVDTSAGGLVYGSSPTFATRHDAETWKRDHSFGRHARGRGLTIVERDMGARYRAKAKNR